jgi:hypothetical protein
VKPVQGALTEAPPSMFWRVTRRPFAPWSEVTSQTIQVNVAPVEKGPKGQASPELAERHVPDSTTAPFHFRMVNTTFVTVALDPFVAAHVYASLAST